MELTLTVQPPASPAIDVDFNVDASRTVKDVVEALVKATGVPAALSPDMSLYLPNRDSWLSNEMSVGQVKFRKGEVVVLGRNSAGHSVIIGDIVEKSRSSKNNTSQIGTSNFELCVVSGILNGKCFSLSQSSLVVVDKKGNVRVTDSRAVSHGSESQMNQKQFEGVSHIDAASCLVECDSRIYCTPLSGETHVEVRKISSKTEIDEHAMIVAGGVQLFIRRKVVEESLPVSDRGIIGINRPPRDLQPPVERIINIEAPPRDAQKPRFSPLMLVGPLIVGLLFFFIMDNAYFLMFMALSPIMMVMSFFDSKRAGIKEYKAGKAKYVADIDKAVEQLRIGRREELAIRRMVFPDAVDCSSRIIDYRHDIWYRRKEDIDFLAYRIGVGDQAALVSAAIAQGGSEDLREYGEKKLRRTDPIHLAPLAIPLPQYGAIGLVGDRTQTLDVMSWMILQTITLQSHRDVSLCAALPISLAGYFEYFKWLPHIRNGGAELDEPTTAFGEDRSVILFQKLRALIESRASQSSGGIQGHFSQWTSVVVFIDESVVKERSTIDLILKNGPAVGVFVVFLATQFRELPGECRAVVEASSRGETNAVVSVSYPGSGQSPILCDREAVTNEQMIHVAQAIAPMRDITASVSQGGGGALPKEVDLLDVLDLAKPTTAEIAKRWNNSPESLQAILGSTTDGLLKIDLNRDGPHALVAGTTGSGKSELLQTLVASIATSYSPQKVNFLFVDYKGGSAFADCASIPHSVGMVTDLDDYLAQRVLISLNSELKRRESMLREFGVKDLVTFQSRFPNDCPPSLLIVIDEFAALVREVPDFVEGVVDIAQRGRSLGLHLILATQRPAGVINDNIRANTNLRIALRIADSSDSSDVIGTDEAARIPRTIPGRAFVRMGPSDLQSFQAAYGGKLTVDTSVQSEHVEQETQDSLKQPIVVQPFSLLNVVTVQNEDDLEIMIVDDKQESESHLTDIRYLCAVIKDTAVELQIKPPRQPWKQPLAQVIPLSSIGDMNLLDQNDPGRRAILGVIDLPQLQDQHTFAHDFENDGNIFVYGASSSGKTTTLRTIAGSLAVSASPNDVVIYGIDCASGGLECLKELPHCASVITSRDAESMSHFLSRMSAETEMRKELFRREGVSSLGEFRIRMKNNAMETSVSLPRIVVLLDSFAGYSAAFEKVEYGAWIDQIQRLTAEGRPLGIHVVITADRRGAIPFNMAGLVEQKIILKMADPDELSSLGVPHKIAKEIKLTPGRALLRGELELQIPIVSNDPDGASQATSILQLAEKLKTIYGDISVAKVPTLPDHVSLVSLPQPDGYLKAVMGVAVSEVGLVPCGVDLGRGHFLIAGGRETGKSTSLVSLISSLSSKKNAPAIFVFTPRPNFISSLPNVHNIAVGSIACEEQMNELIQASMQMDASSPDIVVVVDDCEDLAEGTFGISLESLMRELKQKIHVVAAGDQSAFARAYSGWLSEVKKGRSGLLLKPDPQLDGEITGVKISILPGQTFPPGRGYLCLDRQSVLMQVGM